MNIISKNSILLFLFFLSISIITLTMFKQNEPDGVYCYICFEEEIINLDNELQSKNVIVHKIDKHVQSLIQLIQSYKEKDYNKLIALLSPTIKQDVYSKLNKKDKKSKEQVRDLIFEEMHKELIFILKNNQEAQKYAKQVLNIIKEFIKLLSTTLKEEDLLIIRDNIFNNPDFNKFILLMAFDGSNEAAEFLIENPSIPINSNDRAKISEISKKLGKDYDSKS